MRKRTESPEPAVCKDPGRRCFLQGVAAAAALGALGLVIHRRSDIEPADEVYAPAAVGPMVCEGLTAEPHGDELWVMAEGEHVMTADPTGWELMLQADGSRTLEELIFCNGLSDKAEAVADLFLTLGMTGWLQNRLEVRKYAVGG